MAVPPEAGFRGSGKRGHWRSRASCGTIEWGPGAEPLVDADYRFHNWVFLAAMQVKFFVVPLKALTEAEEEANVFLRSHRVLSVERQFVDNGENSFWTLAVEYLDGEQAGQDRSRSSTSGRIDYKQLLSPEDFAVFSRLREVRKQLAAKESVPVYTVFSNEQLAKMVTGKVDSKAAMREIKGVGEATVEKYAEPVLAVLKGTGGE